MKNIDRTEKKMFCLFRLPPSPYTIDESKIQTRIRSWNPNKNQKKNINIMKRLIQFLHSVYSLINS